MRHYYKLLIGIGIILLFGLFLRNLNSPNLWYDEAGQFWMAKGLHHFSEPYSQDKGIKSMISINRGYNLDPGGFTLALRFWLKISTHHIWLRVLPLIFFILTYLLLMFFIKKWTSNPYLALGLPSLLFLSPLVIQYSFEIRPYSWAFFSAILIYFFITKLYRSENRIHFLLSGLVLSCLIWGRYNIIIQIAGALTLIFIFQIREYRNFKSVFFRMFWIGIPIFISFILVFFLEMRFQWNTGTNYAPEVTIQKVSNFIFKWDFVRSIIPFIIYLISFVYLKNKFPHYAKDSFILLFYFFIILNVIYIIISTFGYYPYHPGTRWNIDIVVLSIFGITSVISMIYNILADKHIFYDTLFFTGLIGVFFITFIHFTQKENLRDGEYGYYYNEFEQTASLFQKLSENKTHVSKISLLESRYYPNVRYLFEYGVLKNSPYLPIYPEIDFLYKSWFEEFNSVDFEHISCDCLIIPGTSNILLKNYSASWSMFETNGFKCYYINLK